MTESATKEIGGKQWTVVLLPATKGLDVGRRLVKLLGPAIGKAVSGGRGILDAEISGEGIGAALGELAERLGEPEAAALVKELVTTGVICDGKEVTPVAFELLFRGDYQTLLAVAAFVVEANFAIPLGSWLDTARASVKRPKPSATPATPTS
jgi:hypothetical protein